MTAELKFDEKIFLYLAGEGIEQNIKNVPQLSFYKSTMVTASPPKRIQYVSFDSGDFSSGTDLLELSGAELQIAKRYVLWYPDKFNGTLEPQAIKWSGYLTDVVVLTQNRDGIPHVIDTKVAFLVTDGAEDGKAVDAIAVDGVPTYGLNVTHILHRNDLLQPGNAVETIRQNVVEPIKATHDRIVSKFVELMNSVD